MAIGSALLAGLTTRTASAQDATWAAPPSHLYAEWTDGTNWSTGTVPTGVATFGNAGNTYVELGVFSGTPTTIQTTTFVAGAPAYHINIGNLQFLGSGIVDHSSSAPTFTLYGFTTFANSSSSGDAVIDNSFGSLTFAGASTAGTSRITNDSTVHFQNSSTAGNAQITNNTGAYLPFGTIYGGGLFFQNTSSAGSAQITNNGGLFFQGSSTAANAQITNNANYDYGSGVVGGGAYFQDNSTAGNAQITNNGTLLFQNTSNAASSTITNSGTVSFADNSSAVVATIGNNGTVNFNNASTAAGATLINNGIVNFNDTSSAGGATISNAGSGRLNFTGSSTGATASILNSGLTSFKDTSSAGNAVINNSLTLSFNDTSRAGNAGITNGSYVFFNNSSTADGSSIGNRGRLYFNDTSSAGSAFIGNTNLIQFQGTSTAGNARITNDGLLLFANGSTGGSAVITNNSQVNFQDTSTGGNARLINNAAGIVDFSASAGANNDGRITVGSIEGAGTFYLGARQVTVGGNNLSTTVSGLISDCVGAIPICQSYATGGSLVKAGTGTLTLTATNTYTGGTAITGGTLQLGNGGTTGSIVGDVANNGVLAFNRSNLYQFDGAISGGGAVRQIGAGTTILTATNSYTGGTTISGGMLQLGTGGTTGSIVGDVVNNGILSFDRSNGLRLDGAISGSGLVRQDGSGTTILTGLNSYSGGTILNAGIVSVSADANLGNAVGALTFNGGVLQVTGTTFTTTARTINWSAAGGGFDIADPASTFTLNQALGPGGGLTKTGAGRLVLDATSSYTGATIVDGGTLSVNGDISASSGITVNATGTLGGNGVVPSVTVGSGGTIAPGNSIGTLNVAGHVTFGAGSSYQVEANAAGQSDKIAASGTATLAGGTVQVLAATGNYAPRTTYTILTASSVAGAFAGVTSNMAFLTPALTYRAQDVMLTLDRTVNFTSVAQTGSQKAIAAALDQFPTGNPLFLAVVNQSQTGALTAFDTLSGEIFGSVQTTLATDAIYLRNAVLEHLHASDRSAPGADAGLPGGGAALGYGDETAAPFPIKAPRGTPAAVPLYTVWAQGFGGRGHIDGDGSAALSERTLAGFIGGVDRRVDNWIAGVAAGYSHSDLSVDARASSAGIDSAYLSGYVGATFGAWRTRGGAAYAVHEIGTTRSVMFPGFSDHVTAHYLGDTAQIFGELGYAQALGAVTAEPFAGLAFIHVDTGRFTEAGGGAALAGSGDAQSVGTSSLGLRLDSRVVLANGPTVTPWASVAWQHMLGELTPTASLSFQSTGSGFDVAGVPIARDSAMVDAGVDVGVSANAKIGVAYRGQLAGHAQDHAVTGTLVVHF